MSKPDPNLEPNSKEDHEIPTQDPNEPELLVSRDSEVIEGELVEEVEGESAIEEVSPFQRGLIKAGLIANDVDLFDVVATDGPSYELDEMSIESVVDLCEYLEKESIRWVIDHAGQMFIHRNDERRADEAFDAVFGPEDL